MEREDEFPLEKAVGMCQGTTSRGRYVGVAYLVLDTLETIKHDCPVSTAKYRIIELNIGMLTKTQRTGRHKWRH
jgi:hypothetical protein